MSAGVEPPRYVLLSYDAEAEFNGEDGYEETWAMCADAEGLFGDPPLPRAERTNCSDAHPRAS